MLRTMMKSKIHNATVTESNLTYSGSITIDSVLLEKADILAGEKVHIVNLNNGSRIETYVLEGKANSGVICMNGAAARHAQVGDKVIIISYCVVDSKEAPLFKNRIVVLDEKNKPVKK